MMMNILLIFSLSILVVVIGHFISNKIEKSAKLRKREIYKEVTRHCPAETWEEERRLLGYTKKLKEETNK